MPNALKENYIKPRFLRQFYMVLKQRTMLKYVKIALKGKLVRGFVSTYLGYLEARLLIVVYRLNIINNIFMIKSIINLGVFYINNEKKKHVNTRIKLGDFLQIKRH
jgi:ribosomal protein S4